MIKFNFSDLLSNNLEEIEKLKSVSGYVAYRIHGVDSDRNYSGHTENLYWRLFNNLYGHLTSINREDTECDYVHKCLKSEGIENFEVYVEGVYDTLLEAKAKEAEVANRYECFTKGYNRTQNGNGGSPIGSKVFLNKITGECRYVSPLDDISEYLNNENWINTNRTKGSVTLEKDEDIVMVHPGTDEYSYYISLGYSRLSWKGSVWLKNKFTGEYKHVRDKNLANLMMSSDEFIYEAPTKDTINVFDLESNNFRKISTDEYNRNKSKYIKKSAYEGSLMMINPSTREIKKVYEPFIQRHLNEGWVRHKRTGKVTMYNPLTGEQTCSYDEDYLNKLSLDGWIKGKCNHNGVTFMNNGNVEVKLPSKDNELKLRYLSNGYKYGKLTK